VVHGADVHCTAVDGYSPITYSNSWKYQLSNPYLVSHTIAATIEAVHPPDQASLLHPACVLERYPEHQRHRVAVALADQARARGLADDAMAVGTTLMVQGRRGHYVGWEKRTWGPNIHLIHLYVQPDEYSIFAELSSLASVARICLRDVPDDDWLIVPEGCCGDEEHRPELLEPDVTLEVARAKERHLESLREVCAMVSASLHAV
jgi:hypothetical protein